MKSRNKDAAELLTLTTRLIDVLKGEIDMLRQMEPNRMQELQRDKMVLAAAYESAVTRLKGREDDDDPVDPELRNDLKAATEVFHKALRANERALSAAREASQRLLSHIVAEVERQSGQSAGYIASGAVASLAGGRPTAPLSISVDQSL